VWVAGCPGLDRVPRGCVELDWVRACGVLGALGLWLGGEKWEIGK